VHNWDRESIVEPTKKDKKKRSILLLLAGPRQKETEKKEKEKSNQSPTADYEVFSSIIRKKLIPHRHRLYAWTEKLWLQVA